MNLRSLECPNCGSIDQYYLSAGEDRHLRQCPACGRWFVAAEAGADADGPAFEVTDLGEPPACPVEGCDDTPPSEELPAHIIVVHDGSLLPESG